MWRLTIDYMRLIGAYLRANLNAQLEYRGAFISEALAMFINDGSWVAFWILFFQRFPVLNGWDLRDVLAVWAITTAGFGIAHSLMGNGWHLANVIMNGQLDLWMLYPRAVLPHLLLGRTIGTVGRRRFRLRRIPGVCSSGLRAFLDVRDPVVFGCSGVCRFQRRLGKFGVLHRQRKRPMRTMAFRGDHIQHVSADALQRPRETRVVYSDTRGLCELHSSGGSAHVVHGRCPRLFCRRCGGCWRRNCTVLRGSAPLRIRQPAFDARVASYERRRETYALLTDVRRQP